MRDLLPILCGAALGAALSVPVRLICGVLLRKRGFDSEMERKHFWILIGSLTLVGGVIGWRAGFTFRGLYLILLLLTSACAFYIDARHRVIPNELVLAILILAAVFGFTQGPENGWLAPLTILSALVAVSAGVAFVIVERTAWTMNGARCRRTRSRSTRRSSTGCTSSSGRRACR